jgi:ATP-dependent Clp protease protease subunit
MYNSTRKEDYMKILYNVDELITERNYDDLLKSPVIIRITEINDSAASDFSKSISRAHRTGQPVIPVLIDSPGGAVYSCLSMMSDIKHSNIPVATIAVGHAMSCGAVLLSCGTKGYRYCDPYATVMIHDVFSGCEGKTAEMKSHADQNEALSERLFKEMSKSCGLTDDNYFLDMIHKKKHAEWYLSPKDAKKHKIVDHIGNPDFHVDISVTMKFK